MSKMIITVVGKDTIGIIAKVCTGYYSDHCAGLFQYDDDSRCNTD